MWCKKKKWPRPYRRAIQYPIEAFEVPMHDVHSTKESWCSEGASLWQKMTFSHTDCRKCAQNVSGSSLQHESLHAHPLNESMATLTQSVSIMCESWFFFSFFLSSRRAERRGIISHFLFLFFFVWVYFHLIFYITHYQTFTHKTPRRCRPTRSPTPLHLKAQTTLIPLETEW